MNRDTLEIEMPKVARFFFWMRYWFLLAKFGKKMADRQTQALNYFIENDVLYVTEGLWWLQRKCIPLPQITNINLTQNPLTRLFKIWTIKIHTAGQNWYNLPEATLYGVKDHERIRDFLFQEINRVGNRSTNDSA